jgi:glycosyltransferase involved in cell wall biosynthesis
VKVCMLVHNTYVMDTRVRKEAHALAEAGHEVVVLALRDTHRQLPEEEWEGPVRILRRHVTNLVQEWRRSERLRLRDLQMAMRALNPSARTGRAREAGPVRRWLRKVGAVPGRLLWTMLRTCGRAVLRMGAGTVRFFICTARDLLDRPWWSRLSICVPARLHYYSKTMLPLAVEQHADVYHAHDLWTLRVGRAAARRNRAALVYDSHELECRRYAPSWFGWERLVWWREERLLAPLADAILTVSRPIAGELKSMFHPRRLAVIYNCPSLDSQDAAAETDGLRTRLGAGDRKLLIFVGGIGRGRGLLRMLDVMQRLGEDYLFVLFGPLGIVSDGKKYPQLVAGRGLDSQVKLMGVIPDSQIIATIAQADCSIVLTQDVSLSHRYSLPNKLFQSAFAGTPVVASDLPCIADVVRRFRLGIIVDPEDPPAIAEAIRDVCRGGNDFCKDPQKRGALLAEFGWPANQRRLVALYQTLARSREGGPRATS